MTLTVVELDDQAYDQALGRAVAAELKLRGAKHKDVAQVIGLDPTLLSARLNGKTPFKASELGRIAMAVGCAVEDFYRHLGGGVGSGSKRPGSSIRSNRSGPGRKTSRLSRPRNMPEPPDPLPVAAGF